MIVKVKRYVKALSLVNVHKQLQGLCERPVLGRWFLAPLVPLPARKSASVPKAFGHIDETGFT